VRTPLHAAAQAGESGQWEVLAGSWAVGAFAAVAPLELRAHAQGGDAGHAVYGDNTVEVVDLVLKQFAEFPVGPQVVLPAHPPLAVIITGSNISTRQVAASRDAS
jgi:hypothetical protein